MVLFLHSAGGFLGSAAIEGLSVDQRAKQGKNGGVKKLVFLSAGILPEGQRHASLPFFDFQGDRMYCKNPISNIFSDLPTSEAENWLTKLDCQPAFGWNEEVTYGGWKDVPSVYLCCKNDTIVPVQMQLLMAGVAGSEIEYCSAGHMVMLSQPDRVVELVRKAAGENL